jgi:heptosyltransferase-2
MRNFCIVEGLGLRVDPTDALIDLQLEQSASLKKPRERISRIAIAPGSVWRTKRWSTAGFVDLSRLLIDSGMELVLIGGPADAPVAARICSSLPAGAPVENLVGKLTLRESAKVIEAAGFLISNDTAPLHLASATGTPAVAVFCATIPEFGFTPWNIPHRIVGRRDLSCRPCGRHGGNDCPTGTHLCRRGIPASVVMAAVNELFQEIGENAA